MTDILLVERKGPIATLKLNRPEKRNALNRESWTALGDAMDELSADGGLRCVIVRGAGDEAFCSGADISEFDTIRASVEQARAYNALVHETMTKISTCAHPTIAMIKGACIGGGLEVAIKCDLRISGESGRFGIPSNRLGLVLSHDEVGSLMELVGRSTTLEILFEARILRADEAKEKGLVTRVVPDAEVEAAALESALRIADGAPLVNRWHKKFARRLLDPTPITPEEREEGYAAFGTEDFRTGYQAFLAKEKPRFQGR
jgi:enoyl-CoA hydratase/carnithine racemase